MEERLDFIVHEKKQAGGLTIAVALSAVFHVLLLVWFMRSHRPIEQTANAPIARYVELMRQNPSDFVEAPGPKLDRAPSPDAALSDGNRRASMPEPTGDRPTNRPGDGGGLYEPPPMQPQPRPSPPPAASAPAAPAFADAAPETQPLEDANGRAYRQEQQPVRASAAAGMIDWKSAIAEAGRGAKASNSGQNFDLGGIGGGGEQGFAEAGPLSFETQWYDWGDYAASMVAKIRYHWRANMPRLIRTGLKGSVTIRFTIEKSGNIRDVEILDSSNTPPYDFAAQKAIELASPLNALPKDFPNSSERVTAIFYYNMDVPARR